MKIIVEATPKEIAALVLELQERQKMNDLPLTAKKLLMEEGEEHNGFYIG